MIQVIYIVSRLMTETVASEAYHAHPCTDPFVARAIDRGADRAFPKLDHETRDEADLDHRFHVYGVLQLSHKDEQKYNDKLNKPGYRYGNKRNRRYRYRSHLG